MTRRARDFYETPGYFVEQLIARIPDLHQPHGVCVLEPCAGDGAIARYFPDCDTNDLDEDRPAHFHFDSSEPYPVDEPWDWIISNPPFNAALGVIRTAVATGIPTAMLLRISFLEPTRDRVEFLTKNPPTGLIYLPRYSFTQNGKSDMSTVMWAIWNYSLQPAIHVAPRFP